MKCDKCGGYKMYVEFHKESNKYLCPECLQTTIENYSFKKEIYDRLKQLENLILFKENSTYQI